MNRGDQIQELLKHHPKGLTIEDVSRKLGLNRITAAKYLNSLVVAGEAEMREVGRAKIFFQAKRLPLGNLLELSGNMMVILDDELFIHEVSPSVLTCFELGKDALSGKRIEHTPLASYLSATHLNHLQNALEGEKIVLETTFNIGENRRFFKISMVPLVFEDGGRAVALLFEDISKIRLQQEKLEKEIQGYSRKLVKINRALQNKVEEYKLAEATLVIKEAVLQSMLNATTVGVALIVNRKMKKINRSLCDILGYSDSELIGQDTRMIYPDEEEYRRISRELYPSAQSQGFATLESRLRRKDGVIIDIIFSLCLINPGNLAAGVTATVVDITERKKTEEALKKANAQIALLTSVTRHDIMNQLSVLRGYIGYLKKFKFDDTVTEIINKEALIADTIWDQILYTRYYRDIGVNPPTWVTIHDTLGDMQEPLDTNKITLYNDLDNFEIFVDPLITRVFAYLVDNSIRHGKKVTEIRLSHLEYGEGLTIVVADNGVGIPEDAKELIFERGYGKHFGLGLSLIREILAITDITIVENGIAGQGARFEITLPKGTYRIVTNPETEIAGSCQA